MPTTGEMAGVQVPSLHVYSRVQGKMRKHGEPHRGEQAAFKHAVMLVGQGHEEVAFDTLEQGRCSIVEATPSTTLAFFDRRAGKYWTAAGKDGEPIRV